MRSLISGNVEALQQLLTVLEEVPEYLYFAVPREVQFGMGRHVRHILDLYENLKTGMHTGEVDYDRRDRDSDAETEIDIAREKIQTVIAWLQLEPELDRKLEMKTGISLSTSQVVSITSSLSRELCYSASHTVHHLASIAMIARLLGLKVPHDVGSAPATLSYMRSHADPAKKTV